MQELDLGKLAPSTDLSSLSLDEHGYSAALCVDVQVVRALLAVYPEDSLL